MMFGGVNEGDSWEDGYMGNKGSRGGENDG